MTDNSDGPTLDLSNTVALAQSIAADFQANKEFRDQAFDRLFAWLQADDRFNIALVEAALFFAEEISADADLFSDIVRLYAQTSARGAIAQDETDS